MADNDDGTTPILVLLAQMAGAVGGGSLVAFTTGDPYAMQAASSSGQAALQAAAERIGLQRRAKAARMLEHAADVADRGVDELMRDLLDDGRLLELLATAIEAAMRAIDEQKVRTIGTALASGALAADDAEISIELQITRAVADLETPHVRVLAHLAGMTHRRSLSVDELRTSRTLEPLRQGMDGLVAVLRSHGLVDQAAMNVAREVRHRERTGDPRIRGSIASLFSDLPFDNLEVTNFGRTVLDRYRSEGEREDDVMPGDG